MLKKIVVCSVVSLFLVCGSTTMILASDSEAEHITLNADGKKPVVFPHKVHQDAFACAECHHDLADGKQIPYTEGMEIKKCATCHTGDTLAGKTAGKYKLDTMKGAGHGNCLECHKKMQKENAALKEKKLSKCATCHPKKD